MHKHGILINLHNNYLNPSFFIIISKKAVRYVGAVKTDIEENPWKKREIRDIMSILIIMMMMTKSLFIF